MFTGESIEQPKLQYRKHFAILKCREVVTKKAKAENDMTKTLVVLVLMFMSCQLVNPVRRILFAVLPVTSRGCGSLYFYYIFFTSVPLVFDVSSHFFIYSVCNKRFTEKLAQKWRRLVATATVAPALAVGPVALGPAAAAGAP